MNASISQLFREDISPYMLRYPWPDRMPASVYTICHYTYMYNV